MTKASASFNFSEKVHMIGRRNAGSALLCLFQALGIGTGDAVFLPALAPDYILNCVVYMGATPVFCDISEKNMCISCKSLKKAVQKTVQEKKLEPRAVLIYDFCGFTPDFKSINEFCTREGLLTVELCDRILYKGECDAAVCAVKTADLCAGLIFTDIRRTADALHRLERSDAFGFSAPLLAEEWEKVSLYYSTLSQKRASRRQKAKRLTEKLSASGLTPAFDMSDKNYGFASLPFFAKSIEHKLEFAENKKARFYSPLCTLRTFNTGGGRDDFPAAFAVSDTLIEFE